MRLRLPRRTGAEPWLTLLVGGLIAFVAFYAKGGLNLESLTTVEIALTLASGASIAAVALLAPPGGARGQGLAAVALLLALAVLSGVSVVWSVAPNASFQDSGRLLAYAAVFAAAVALVRVAPQHWAALLGGLTLAAAIVCGYALLTKVFPGTIGSSNSVARLEEPLGYWNAVGLTAAMGAIGCMWLGARRSGHALLSALAYPAMGVMLLTLALAYSRGATAALAVGLLAWFCIVPLRLRGASLLLLGGAAAAAVAAWDFSTHALSSEGVPLAERTSAGHELGALVVTMLVLLLATGIAIGFSTGRRAPSPLVRRRAGATLLTAIVLALAALAGALAHSQRGFTGSISHVVSSLTDPNARTPPNTPDRLTAVASVRARYWKEAFEVFDAHPALGSGAGGYGTARLRYRKETLEVRHAHGFVVQTLADLGLLGLALALALLLTWMAAAGRATHPFDRSWSSWEAWRGWRPAGVRARAPGEEGATARGGRPVDAPLSRPALREAPAAPGWRRIGEESMRAYTPERVGLLSMLCLVITFGAHSLVDWTWYVPANACVALIAAGWLAGRGPLGEALPARAPAGSAAVRPVPAAAVQGGRERETGAPDALARGRRDAAPARPAHGNGPERTGLSEGLLTRLPARAQTGGARMALAVCVLAAALLAAWSQWEPQRSEAARNQALERLNARDLPGARAAAEAAVSRDPLSAPALETLADVELAEGRPAQARATLQKAVREQPANWETWLALGRFDLARQPRAALAEIQAAIYLNPQSIAPEAVAGPRPQPEAVRIHNDYVRALRGSQAVQTPLRSGHARRGRAAGGAPTVAPQRSSR